jgi:dTDP-4-dehydrorhamnose reductase
MLPSIGDVFAFNRQQLDLSKPADLRRTIEETKPHLIVNAAAYTEVDQAESDGPTARAVNTDAPALMATEAKKIGAALVHYSTDYVFDGLKNSPYLENDLPNPVNAYGKTKLAGEQAVVEAGGPHLIFRTAWVYATHGRNFLLTIVRLASQRRIEDCPRPNRRTHLVPRDRARDNFHPGTAMQRTEPVRLPPIHWYLPHERKWHHNVVRFRYGRSG